MPNTKPGNRIAQRFKLLSNSVRVEILRSLAEKQRNSPTDPTVAFTELREEVGVSDPGNFNYHIDKLNDIFIYKSNGEYRLSNLGIKITGAIIAEAYNTDNDNICPDIEVDCPVCESRLNVTYDDGFLKMLCENGHGFQNDISPNIFEDRSTEEITNYITTCFQQDVEKILNGFCPMCDGRMEGRIKRTECEGITFLYEGICKYCGISTNLDVKSCILHHPAVISFLYSNGIDVRDISYWDLDTVIDDISVGPHASNEILLSVELSGEILEIEMDMDGRIGETQTYS